MLYPSFGGSVQCEWFMLNRQGGSCDVGLLRTVHLAWPLLLQDFPNLLIKFKHTVN